MSFSNSCVLRRKDFHLNRLFYLLITLLNHLFIILMVRVIACNSKAVSFSSICICPERVYKPKLIFYSISQPNHLHLILYNNFYSLYIVYINFLCFFIFLAVRVGLTNYTSRTNIYFDCPRGYSTIWDTCPGGQGWIRTNICLGHNLLIYSQLKPHTHWDCEGNYSSHSF